MSFPKVIIKYEIPRVPLALPPSGGGGGIGPVGPPGPPGPSGPSAVSDDADNKAILGSDSLILVQGTKAGVAATTHGQTVSGDDPQLRNARTPTAHHASHEHGGADAVTITYSDLTGIPVSFAPSLHAPTHESGGSDALPLDRLAAPGDSTLLNASTSAHGLLSKLDGNTAHYLDGTGHWTAPVVTGGGGGDMTKAVYDTNNDGIVDKAAVLSTPGAAHQFWKNGNLWVQVDWADLTSIPANFSPSPHAPTHRSGGADSIKLDELAAPTDSTILNASTTAHGLLAKLSGLVNYYLDGTGAWSVPAGGISEAPVNGNLYGRRNAAWSTTLWTDIGSIPAYLPGSASDNLHVWGGTGWTLISSLAVAWSSLTGVPSGFTPVAHAPTHRAGGFDPLALDTLASPTDNTSLNVSITAHGLCPKAPNSTAQVLRGDGAFGTLAYSSLGSIPSAFSPSPHAATHESGGSDAIPLDLLALPSDTANLNSSSAAHGLLRKLDNNSTHYLDGTGSWTTPAGGAGGGGINAFTFTAVNFTVPPIGQTVTVTVQDASWMVIGQMLWIDTAGGGTGMAGEMQVQTISGTSVTLLNVSVGVVAGDMTKAVYDPDNDGVVETADALAALPGNAALYYDGTGHWTAPAGGGGPASAIWGETPVGSIDGTNINYTTANPYTSGHLAVYLNGLRLRRTSDYTETGSQSFKFVSAPLPGDSLSIDYM